MRRHLWVRGVRRSHLPLALLLGSVSLVTTAAAGQTLERATFEEAVQRAIQNHPTVQRAAADIIRADAILQQVGARSRPGAALSFATSVIGPVTRFSGSAITPRTQTATTSSVSVIVNAMPSLKR